MVSQNVLNLVDTAMVGTLGNAALAAVGIGGFVVFMCQAFILGVSTGVQAIASRRKGAGRTSEMAIPLNAGLLLVFLISPFITWLVLSLTPGLYPFLNSDPEVIEQGVPYVQVRIIAVVFVGMNFAFRGYWSAIDLTRVYMQTLIIMHSLNIVLNYVLIFGKLGAPALGVMGAGLATTIATGVGTAIYFVLALGRAREHGFLKGLPPFSEIKTLVHLSTPSGIQQTFFASGFVALYWIIGKVGTPELAAANVLINITLVAILPCLGFGIAAATLVGQALGRNDSNDAEQWGWDVAKVALCVIFVVGIPMWVAPDLLLKGFIHDHDTLDIARVPMRLVGLLIAIDAIGLVLMHALLGAGDAKRVMMVSITAQWILFLPVAYLAGPILGYGLLALWVLQGAYRAVQAGVFVQLWRQREWASIRV